MEYSPRQRPGVCRRRGVPFGLPRGLGNIVWMWLFVLLAGCAVGPDFQSPDPPDVPGYLPRSRASALAGDAQPRGFAFRNAGDVPARWWELLHSRALTNLVEAAIIHNADLQAAEAAVRVAQANALAQRGSLFPTVAANFNSSRQKIASSLSSPVTSNANLFSLHTAQVTVSYAADLFGGTRRLIEASEALAEAQAFQRELVYLTLTANVALAAIQEASLRGQIAVTHRQIALQSQLLDVLRAQNASGQIALPDVVAQETAVAQARLLLPTLEKQLAQHRDLLAFLVGRFPSEDVPGSFQLTSFRLPTKLPLSLPADLVRQRPDVRVAEANLHATNAQVGVAIANRLPQITLSGNAGSTAAAVGQLFTPGTGFWMIAGNAAQTVFDAGTLANKQIAAEETSVQAAALYRSTVLTAFQNVADTLRALEADSRAVSAATTAERSAARNIELVRDQVERGQVSIPVLLSAQQAFLQTSLARVQTEALLLADTVALFQALGGGWWNRPEAVAGPRSWCRFDQCLRP
jgi:NodT family efflux transporter outer membrane factor (OMF) lipoprotein